MNLIKYLRNGSIKFEYLNYKERAALAKEFMWLQDQKQIAIREYIKKTSIAEFRRQKHFVKDSQEIME